VTISELTTEKSDREAGLEKEVSNVIMWEVRLLSSCCSNKETTDCVAVGV
jgi:hypothetical protein